jgi:acetyl-CoA synthetase
MLWVGKNGEERNFTFGDMKRWSDKTANYLRSLGIQKGDPVMVVLKRHYQFWFCALALHKLGAVLIPATYMMTAHDVKYRVDSASVKAVICTTDGDVGAAIEQAESECPTLKLKMMVNGAREGWMDFDAGIAAANEKFERVATNVHEPMLLYFSSGTSGYPKMVLHDYSYALGHLLTAKHWHCVVPDGLHLSIADTGWGKAVWGKFYGQWLMEAGVLLMIWINSYPPRF